MTNSISEEYITDSSHDKSTHLFNRNERTVRKKYVLNQYRIASISYSLSACFLGLVIATVEPLKTCNYRFSISFRANKLKIILRVENYLSHPEQWKMTSKLLSP